MTEETALRLADAMETLAHELSMLDIISIEELTAALNDYNEGRND